MRRSLALCGLALLLATAAAPARVIELHRNAGFDRDLAGVSVTTPVGGSAAWTAADLSGNPASGALRLDGPPGYYRLGVCLVPEALLKPVRHFYEFSVRASGAAGSTLLHDGNFNFYGDSGVFDPCDGPWVAFVRRFATVAGATRVDASIGANAWPGLYVVLHVTKADDSPMLIDDWSVHVDEDLIFRDDDEPATVFSL